MKTRRKLFSMLLAFCMLVTLFAGVPADAARDNEYEQKEGAEIEPVYGLIATQWLDYNEDDLLLKDGYPAYADEWDENGPVESTLHPIDYAEDASVSTKGGRFWFDYRASVDGERTHVTAKDITVKYYPDSNPWEDDARVEEKTDVLTDGKDGVVIFVPHDGEFGEYCLFYKDKLEYFALNVDYPTIGFYSAPERSADNLLLDEYSWNSSSNNSMYYGAKNVVYMNTYGDPYSTMEFPAADAENPAFALEFWNDESSNRLTGGADGIENYLAVEEVSDASDIENDHWYKLTFNEEMLLGKEQLAKDFELNVTMVRTDSWMNDDDEKETGDPYSVDAWFRGAYHSLGLTATVDDEVYTSRDTINESIGTPLVYPEHFKISFKETYMDDEGKVQSRDVDTAKIKLEKDKNWGIFDEEGNPKEPEWGVATDQECNMTITDGVVDCLFHYQGIWRFSFGTEEYIYVNSWLYDVTFWEDPQRPEDSELLDKRLTETTVDEGKTQKIYALAWVDNDNAYAPKTNTIAIKAYVGGTEKPDYIKVDETPTTDNREVNHFFGYGVEITDAATEDFTIVVTAERNKIDIKRDDEGNVISSEKVPGLDEEIRCEFVVKVNAIKELKIAAPPKKTTYAEGETFSSEGMVVNAVYADGKEEAITNYSVSPDGKLSASDTSVMISYHGKQASQAITVNAKQSQATPSPVPLPPLTTPSPAPLAKGKKVEDSKTGNHYKVTNVDTKNPTVEYTTPKKNTKGSVTIPDTVTINGTKYKVTSIAAGAFKNDKKITKVTVGKNITSIGKNAFSGCEKLKTITIKSTKLKSIGKNAFKGVSKKITIEVPKSKKKTYTKILKKAGFRGKVK